MGDVQPWNSLWAHFNEPEEAWQAMIITWGCFCLPQKRQRYWFDPCRSLCLSYIIQIGAGAPPPQHAKSNVSSSSRSPAHQPGSRDLAGKSSNLLAIITFLMPPLHKEHLAYSPPCPPPFPPISLSHFLTPAPRGRGRKVSFRIAWPCFALCPPPGDSMRESCQTSHGGAVKNTCIPLLIIYWCSLLPLCLWSEMPPHGPGQWPPGVLCGVQETAVPF